MVDIHYPLAAEKGMEKMPRKQNSAKKLDVGAVLGGQEDFLRPLIREVLQQVMEAEMEEAVGAEKASGRRIESGTGQGITAGRWSRA